VLRLALALYPPVYSTLEALTSLRTATSAYYQPLSATTSHYQLPATQTPATNHQSPATSQERPRSWSHRFHYAFAPQHSVHSFVFPVHSLPFVPIRSVRTNASIEFAMRLASAQPSLVRLVNAFATHDTSVTSVPSACLFVCSLPTIHL